MSADSRPPPDLISLHRRLNRETVAHRARHAGHRERLTALLGEAPGETLGLLGAGNCNDVDLPALGASFREIHLLDLDLEAVTGARDRQPPDLQGRIRLHAPVDLSGGLARLTGWKGRPVAPAQLGALPGQATAAILTPLGLRWGTVASTCLLGQIVHTCQRVLGPDHPQIEAIACALVLAHLRALVHLIEPGGCGLLVTDTVSSETYPLEELWDSRSPTALLDELEATNNHLSGTSPTFLRRILRTDPIIAPLLDSVRLVPPWLWRLNPEVTLLVYALVFRRRA